MDRVLALGLLVALVLWANQRETALHASETRANQAEARAATAEAIVTVQAGSQAATSTALAYVNSPEAAVDRGLSLVLAVEREPTEQRIRALGDAFAPAALVVLRPRSSTCCLAVCASEVILATRLRSRRPPARS